MCDQLNADDGTYHSSVGLIRIALIFPVFPFSLYSYGEGGGLSKKERKLTIASFAFFFY